MNPEDARMLRELLALVEDEEERFNARALRDMAERERPLSEKQRTWVHNIYEKLIGEPQYENLISSGKAPRGREVPTPEVLRNLPKRSGASSRRNKKKAAATLMTDMKRELRISAIGSRPCERCGLHAPLRTLEVNVPERQKTRISPACPAGWAPLIMLCNSCWTDVVSMLS